MLKRAALMLMGALSLLIGVSAVFGHLLPPGRQIAFSAWVNNHMMTQVIDVERGATYRLPSSYGNTTPVAWLDGERLLVMLRRVEFGAQPGAAVLTLGGDLRVLDLPANCFTDTISGAGGYLACLERDGSHLLVQTLACALEGCPTPARRIEAQAPVFAFSWSPTGALLALNTVHNLGMGIEVIEPASGAPVFIDDDLGTGNPRPTWSPDGRSLAYLMRRERRLWLQVVDLGSRRLTQSISLDFLSSSRPFTLSPDGARVMLISGESAEPYLATIDLHNAAASQLTNDLFIPAHQLLQWSPDGTQIALYAHRADIGGGLVLIDAQTGSARMLASTPLLGDHYLWRPCHEAACSQ